MYTCDECGQDVNSPENLIRVWEETGARKYAILVCSDCLEYDSDTGQYYTVAEEDASWVYCTWKAID